MSRLCAGPPARRSPRRIRWLLGVGCALGTAAILVPPALAAAGDVTSGWWNETTVGPLTAPSATPADQIEVGNGVTGPTAVAAVGFPAPPAPATGAALTLVIPANGSVGSVAVSACPTTSAWKSGGDQPAGTAPHYNCAVGERIDGKVSGNNETWDIPALWAAGGRISVALVPTPGTTAPFSVTYQAPTDSSVAPTGAVSAPPGSAAPSYTGGTVGVPSAAPSPAGSGNVGGSGSPVAAAPLPSSPPAAASAVSAPASAVSPVAPTGNVSPPVLARPGVPAAGGSTPAALQPASVQPLRSSAVSRAARVLAVGLLLATGLTLFFLAGRPDRAPRLLRRAGLLAVGVGGGGTGSGGSGGGRSGTVVIGGLGRFARPRSGPPRRL